MRNVVLSVVLSTLLGLSIHPVVFAQDEQWLYRSHDHRRRAEQFRADLYIRRSRLGSECAASQQPPGAQRNTADQR